MLKRIKKKENSIDFDNIIIESKNKISEKEDCLAIDFQREAIIYCLLVNEKISIMRKNYDTKLEIKQELSPYQIFNKINL